MKNVVWRSEENSLGVVIELLALPYSHSPQGLIEYDGKTIDIVMNWSDSSFRIDPIDYYGKYISFKDYDNPQYILGQYEIIQDNKVTLKFSKDDLFGGELINKKIVITANEIDPADYEIGLHQEVCWESASGLTLFTYQGMRRFSIGQYAAELSSKEIVLYWLDDKAFSAYELKDRVQGQEELLSGRYDYDGQILTLHFVKNLIDEQSDSIEMTARNINYWEHPQELWYPDIEEP